MGTIVKRQRKDGSVAYLAQIILTKDRKIIHSESLTFDRRPAAAAWLKKREAELARTDNPRKFSTRNATFGDVIDRYIAESKRVGRTKLNTLQAVKHFDISKKKCSDLKSPDIVEFCQLLLTRVQPQTVDNYISHMATIFAIARPAWDYDLEPQAMLDAIKVARRLGLISRSRSRERRPTLNEMNSLMDHFYNVKKKRPSSNPMHRIVAFAVFSTRRLDEITRITWADFDESGQRVMVRDMKHPGEKIGNDIWCGLPLQAIDILLGNNTPRSGYIFPYNGESISTAFTRACKILGIGDLHFHDLRHEGISRLFEIGLDIPRVASVSGHRSWNSLKRYTHLRQVGDKYADWDWLQTLKQDAHKLTKRL